MKKLLLTSIICFLTISAFGAEKAPKWMDSQNWAQLKKWINPLQVTNILGNPLYKDFNPQAGIWYYQETPQIEGTKITRPDYGLVRFRRVASGGYVVLDWKEPDWDKVAQLEAEKEKEKELQGPTPEELEAARKEAERLAEEKRIAEEALKHIKDGQAIMLDTGTTTLQIAKELIGKRKVTIITTSLAIVSQLQFAEDIKVILLGGFLRGGSPDMHGPLTEQNIEQFKTDIAFMGADAIDSNGNTYTDDLRVVNLDKKIASNASQVIVVADSSKFDTLAMCKVLEPKDYNLLITAKRINARTAKQLRKKRIKLKIV